eukprot:6930683-Alexandrium_andersonii.AAC.1
MVNLSPEDTPNAVFNLRLEFVPPDATGDKAADASDPAPLTFWAMDVRTRAGTMPDMHSSPK